MLGKLTNLIGFAGFAATLIGPVYAEKRPVTVFAAASLTTVLSEVAEMATRIGLPRCRCVFAASSALARQIANGAPSDIFISANRHWVNQVIKARVMDGKTQQIIARNRLVLVAHADMQLQVLPGKWEMLPNLLEGHWLAMADPDHVPAGMYGVAALKHFRIWNRLESMIARAPNVRAALALVDRGEAAAGIVYSSDIGISDQIKLLATFPDQSHPPIEYAAVISSKAESGVADVYFAFLMSSAVQARFSAHGFLAAEDS